MKSSRQLSKVFTVFLYIISFVFAYFLLQGGSLVIENLPRAGTKISVEDYIDQAQAESIEKEISGIEQTLSSLNFDLQATEAERSGLEKVFALEQESYKELLASRYVTEDSGNNQKVEALREKINKERDNLKTLTSKEGALNLQITEARNDRGRQQQILRELRKDAYAVFDEDRKYNTLKAFGLRLLFVLPLLLIAGFLFKRYRKSKYWPFVYGWGYFSLYAFFVELVPYFPSYGGYVRSIVGIIVCFLVGKILIQKLQEYLDKKRELEQKDEETRRNSLQNNETNLELSFQKISKGVCPSCDRKFANPDNKYCVYCGLCIKKECRQCQQLQVSFNKFCLECGSDQAQDETAAPEKKNNKEQ